MSSIVSFVLWCRVACKYVHLRIAYRIPKRSIAVYGTSSLAYPFYSTSQMELCCVIWMKVFSPFILFPQFLSGMWPLKILYIQHYMGETHADSMRQNMADLQIKLGQKWVVSLKVSGSERSSVPVSCLLACRCVCHIWKTTYLLGLLNRKWAWELRHCTFWCQWPTGQQRFSGNNIKWSPIPNLLLKLFPDWQSAVACSIVHYYFASLWCYVCLITSNIYAKHI